jgi:hypothetical protein
MEKAEIGQFALWGRERLPDGRPHTPVIVLTAIELFCAWQLKQTWRDFGGQRAIMVQSPIVELENLWTLADLTQQVCLGLPDPQASPPPVKPPGSAPE